MGIPIKKTVSEKEKIMKQVCPLYRVQFSAHKCGILKNTTFAYCDEMTY